MSTTLEIKDSFETVIQGQTFAGCQGAAGAVATDPMDITIQGQGQIVPFSVSNNSNGLVWEASNDLPATFEYCHVIADADCWVQFITAGGSVTIALRANVPQVLGKGTMLPNASTTVLDGSGAPAVVNVTKINIVNRSGAAVNGICSVFL
jgi:hypothetical protein